MLERGEREGKQKIRYHNDFWKNDIDKEKRKRRVAVIRLDADGANIGCQSLFDCIDIMYFMVLPPHELHVT